MSYNLRKKSYKAHELNEDMYQKSLIYEKWKRELVELLERKDIYGVKEFIDDNIFYESFRYFLISILPYVQLVYDDIYDEFVNMIRNKNPNLKENIND
ncbi:MAG: hypothetical protein ACOCUI_01000 [bacterium]